MKGTVLENIAITCVPNIGDITAKKLIAYCGSAEAVFKEKGRALEKIPGVGTVFSKSVLSFSKEAFKRAETELEFIQKNKIVPLFYLNANYPKRLVHCEDGPVMLYTKGRLDFNMEKVISIVGTRKASDYGKDFCDQLIADLSPHQPLVISGLAYGIDIQAHRAALKNNLSTAGVLAHGLDKLYPYQHRSTANKMLERGSLVSEFRSGTIPDRENFPKRNRIVAGISDLTIVIESNGRGGSLITANLANNYNRDVFALPGRISDEHSEGCNNLIKTNRAALIQSAKDIEYIMSWDTQSSKPPSQTKLFVELNKEEQQIATLLKEVEKMTIDAISLNSKLSMSKTAASLLEMEFKGVVKSLPGKLYKLI